MAQVSLIPHAAKLGWLIHSRYVGTHDRQRNPPTLHIYTSVIQRAYYKSTQSKNLLLTNCPTFVCAWLLRPKLNMKYVHR